MSLSAKDYKAISWYAKSNDLKPQLSAAPIMHFTNAKGEYVTKNLTEINLEYNVWNEEDKKIRAREREYEKRTANAK